MKTLSGMVRYIFHPCQKLYLSHHSLTDTLNLKAIWQPRQEITTDRVLELEAIAYHGDIQWYLNGQPINGSSQNGRNITRKVTKIGHEIVRDEQTLTVKGESRSGIYQVLATGFNGQKSKHVEVTSYGKLISQYIVNNYQHVHSAVQRGALFLCSLLAATSQFSVLIRQKMQLTGWDNGDYRCVMRRAWKHNLE